MHFRFLRNQGGYVHAACRSRMGMLIIPTKAREQGVSLGRCYVCRDSFRTMAEQKKLTTAEILALARKQGQSGGGAPAPTAAQSEAPDAGEPKPAASPKSTADILAAARAQGAEKKGAEKPAASGAAPKGTADILAAARAQGAGGGAKPAVAPKSTADILAAARSQGAGAKGGSPGAVPTPAATAETKVSPAAAKPVGDRPALKEMVAAVKAVAEGKPAVQAKLPAAAKPKLPVKEAKVTRRSFWGVLSSVTITPFALAWGLMAGIGAIWSLAIARFMMPNMVLELPSRFKVGPPSDFPPGTVSEKYKASRGIWIVHSDQYNGEDMIYALASVCTHLGCTPNWLEGEQKFKCPCHGSGFYVSGINFEGPAPRPLERVGIRRAEDGMLEVDKSVKFQEELGQWADAKSYFPIS